MCYEHVLTQDPERLLEGEEPDVEEARTGSREPEPRETVEVPA